MNTEELKVCLECSTKIMGRSDKKFCGDACRNAYNNKLNAPASNVVRATNSILQKNRRILEQLLKEKIEAKAKIGKGKLALLGFKFDYFTGIYNTKNGNQYYLCYEYGIAAVEDNFYLVVKRN